MIRVDKTVYDKPESADGERILVMTKWPRGVSKEKVDVWMKELGGDMQMVHKWREGKVTWKEFSRSYLKKLKGKEDLLKGLASKSKAGTITLLCSDKDAAYCHRTLLKREIERYL